MGYSVLSHVCEDGTTFDQRMQYAKEGRTPPYLETTKTGLSIYSAKWGRKKYDILYLTPQDVEWLKGIKIDPQVD